MIAARVARGDEIVGYKVGCTSKAIRRQFGLAEPICGRVMAPHVFHGNTVLNWHDYVFKTTGTVWENYAPDDAKPGQPAQGDFVGWTGIVPIVYFLEYGIGLKADAPNHRLTWTLVSSKRCGCERFRFNGHTVTLLAEPDMPEPGKTRLTITSDGPFHLCVQRHGRSRESAMTGGKNSLVLE